ncbi:hypothetical protein [Cellulomonas rhizosphaerae]|uniref:Uncharacterized protein n=1 Tax=Cellulomonas rhizosphaerae TaxID=2293719 RepID=A0A413RJL0_9CELL|nr:hypothetical protein [Cellulomonas rhizosphaerae]RHA38742.1 hypothetical protein D1825_13495 [Cellulomonas rhizosphaerae]
MKPSAYRKWSTQDRGQAEALLEYEASLCPGCGMPRHAAWDPRSMGGWVADAHPCEACEIRDQKAKEDGNEKPHVFVTVRPAQDAATPAS